MWTKDPNLDPVFSRIRIQIRVTKKDRIRRIRIRVTKKDRIRISNTGYMKGQYKYKERLGLVRGEADAKKIKI